MHIDTTPHIRSRIEKIVRFAVYRPIPVLLLTFIFTILSLFLSSKLALKTSNLDLIDKDAPIVSQFLDFAGKFGTPNTLVVVLHGHDPETVKAKVNMLGPALRALPGMRRVIDRVLSDIEAYGRGDISSYLTARNQSAFYLFLQPKDSTTDVNKTAPFVESVKSTLNAQISSKEDVTWGVTGIPQYALDDRDIIQHDISFLSFVSLGLNIALFILVFGTLRRPIIANLVLLVAMIISLGLAALYPGHLTLLSAPFVMMIFGLGIDYGILMISSVEECIRDGMSERDALVFSVTSLARSISTACLTTAAGFFALCFSGFQGFAELGFIAGCSLLICLPTMLVILPAVLSFIPWHNRDSASAKNLVGDLVLRLPRSLLGPLALIFSIAAICIGAPAFDSDYLNLQPANSKAVALEREMIEQSDYSPYFAGFVTNTIEEAGALSERLRSEPLVGAVRSISDFSAMLAAGGGIQSLPPEISGIFNSADGHFAVYAFPSHNIWQSQNETEFLSAMRNIDSNVTGMPFLGNYMIGQTKRALKITGILSAIALFLIVTLDFRRPLPVLLVTLTPLLSVPWMHAFMYFFGLSYNPLNIMALPIVLGTAVDGSVHIVHRFFEAHGNIDNALARSSRGVLLTTLTTLAGFGCLAFTTHRGLQSFSLILTAGISASMILAFTLLPWLLELFKAKLIKNI